MQYSIDKAPYTGSVSECKKCKAICWEKVPLTPSLHQITLGCKEEMQNSKGFEVVLHFLHQFRPTPSMILRGG